MDCSDLDDFKVANNCEIASLNNKKCISVVIPCFNEQDNVIPIYEAVVNCFHNDLSQHSYEILFIDNKSNDTTRGKIRSLCEKDKNAKAIFNIRNFGQFNSPYYGLCQSSGDCTILLCADFQDPIEIIPLLVKEWEEGNKVVCAIKSSSKENSLMYFFRGIYYKIIKRMSDVEQIEHFTGFGLYDKEFIKLLKNLKDTTPFLRGIVAEYAPDRKKIYYQQNKRRAGKTSNDFFKLYDAAMLSFTSYTKIGLRVATFIGFSLTILTIAVSAVYLALKLIFWDRFVAGMIPLILGVFLLGGIQLFFIGLIGEYILNINTRVMDRPIVIEELRINF